MKAKAMKPVKGWMLCEESGEPNNLGHYSQFFFHRQDALMWRVDGERIQRVLITPLPGRKDGRK